MVTIIARHILFARVESAYSPRNRNGYQVVYHTPDLTSDEVKLIEKRVQCYDPVNSDIIRHQFFRTDQGNYVCVKSHQLTPDMNGYRQVVDREGREKAFIAHGLILTANQFSELSHNPWLIFDYAPFINSIDGLTKQIETAIAEVSIRVDYNKIGTVDSAKVVVWPQKDIETLYVLARLGLQNKALNFVGAESMIRQALNTAVLLATKKERTELTFDTVADGCNPAPKTYWAVGAQKRLGGSHYITANLEPPELSVEIRTTPNSDLYDKWLRVQLQMNQGLVREILESIPNVQVLSNSFASNSALPDDFVLDEKIACELLEQNRNDIIGRFNAVLAPYMSEKLAHRLSVDILEDKLSGRNELVISLLELINTVAHGSITNEDDLSYSIYQWLVTNSYRALTNEYNLAHFATTTTSPHLQVLTSIGVRPSKIRYLVDWSRRIFRKKVECEENLASAFEQLFQRNATELQSVVVNMKNLFGKNGITTIKRAVSSSTVSENARSLIVKSIGE